jgi:hypothetical protein
VVHVQVVHAHVHVQVRVVGASTDQSVTRHNIVFMDNAAAANANGMRKVQYSTVQYSSMYVSTLD